MMNSLIVGILVVSLFSVLVIDLLELLKRRK
jgi:hypothetical protein